MKAAWFVLPLAMLAGCEKPGENKPKEAGKRVGEALTDFTSGVGQGIDNRLQVKVEISDEFDKRGLTKTVAKSLLSDQPGKGITVYFISKSGFKGTFIAKAINKDGQEIGRSFADVEFTPDEAKYIAFPFAKETDMQLADRFTLDVRK